MVPGGGGTETMEEINNNLRTGPGQDARAPGQDMTDLTSNCQDLKDRIWTAYKKISKKYARVLSRLASADQGQDKDRTDHPL